MKVDRKAQAKRIVEMLPELRRVLRNRKHYRQKYGIPHGSEYVHGVGIVFPESAESKLLGNGANAPIHTREEKSA